MPRRLIFYQVEHPDKTVKHKPGPSDCGYLFSDEELSVAESPPRKTPTNIGRYKRFKGRNLLEHLIRKQEALLAVAFNREVLFTNNLAERDIRPAKVRQKVSDGLRNLSWAEIYAQIAGFFSSASKHDRSVFTELSNTF